MAYIIFFVKLIKKTQKLGNIFIWTVEGDRPPNHSFTAYGLTFFI